MIPKTTITKTGRRKTMTKNKAGAITPEDAVKEMLKHPEKIGVMVDSRT